MHGSNLVNCFYLDSSQNTKQLKVIDPFLAKLRCFDQVATDLSDVKSSYQFLATLVSHNLMAERADKAGWSRVRDLFVEGPL